MTNYGIDISRLGFDIQSATPEELSFSSIYKTFKIHNRGSGSVSSSSGGGLVTIPHNLGYVPVFLVHVDPGQTGDYCLAPYGSITYDGLGIPTGSTQLLSAYVDSTNLYIKAVANVTTDVYTIGDINDNMGREIGGVGYFTGGWALGAGSGGNDWNGAVRFGNINLGNSESFTDAKLSLYIASRDGSGNVKGIFKGIDVDNVDPFDSVGAFSNPTTSALVSSDSPLNVGDSLEFSINSIVSEITSRVGWSNGNSLGIVFNNNGTASGSGYSQIGSGTNTSLTITKSSETIANYKYTIFFNQLA